jgi:cold shock CspA family protein
VAKGKIKWFGPNRGFGFIGREGEKDLFLHISQWGGTVGTVPQAGTTVFFELGIDPERDPEARQARPAEEGNGESE